MHGAFVVREGPGLAELHSAQRRGLAGPPTLNRTQVSNYLYNFWQFSTPDFRRLVLLGIKAKVLNQILFGKLLKRSIRFTFRASLPTHKFNIFRHEIQNFFTEAEEQI